MNNNLGSKVVKGMFFDLDGTLCNTHEANFYSYQKAFFNEGIVLKEEDFKKVNGHRIDEWPKILDLEIQQDILERIIGNKAEYYAANMHMVKPNYRLIDFFHIMKGHHVTALVTTAKRKNAQKVLEEVGLLELFDFTVFGDDVVSGKPAPEAYVKALELSGLKAEEVIAFEDSEAGAEAAIAAGITVVRVEPNED